MTIAASSSSPRATMSSCWSMDCVDTCSRSSGTWASRRRIICSVPLPTGPMPMRMPTRSAGVRSRSTLRPRMISDSGCGRRPSSSRPASSGTTVPPCTSANWTSQECRAAISRCTFSTEPAELWLRMLPRRRAALAASRSTMAQW
ncbi:MAG: hypothetical protein U1E72_06695 [Burkholderiaceae bacterium]